jgi:hypothetical protein
MALQHRTTYAYFAFWEMHGDVWPPTHTDNADHRRAAGIGNADPAPYNGPTARHTGADSLGCRRGPQQRPQGAPCGGAVDTVRLWRQRWRRFQAVSLEDISVADRLTDVPRPGHPTRMTAEPVYQIVALACEAPNRARRPIRQWTSRELAEDIRVRGIVERISPRHAAGVLKKRLAPPPDSVLAAPCSKRPPHWRWQGNGW